MLNAILLLGSSYNKHKRISMLFTIAMVLNLIFVQFGHVKTIFFIYNTTLLLLISFVNKKISNNTIKIISCSFSIIVWSVLVDIACYYMFPLFNSNLNLIGYITNGILFNFKYVWYNSIILVSINAFEFSVNYLKNKITEKHIIFSENEIKG